MADASPNLGMSGGYNYTPVPKTIPQGGGYSGVGGYSGYAPAPNVNPAPAQTGGGYTMASGGTGYAPTPVVTPPPNFQPANAGLNTISGLTPIYQAAVTSYRPPIQQIESARYTPLIRFDSILPQSQSYAYEGNPQAGTFSKQPEQSGYLSGTIQKLEQEKAYYGNDLAGETRKAGSTILISALGTAKLIKNVIGYNTLKDEGIGAPILSGVTGLINSPKGLAQPLTSYLRETSAGEKVGGILEFGLETAVIGGASKFAYSKIIKTAPELSGELKSLPRLYAGQSAGRERLATEAVSIFKERYPVLAGLNPVRAPVIAEAETVKLSGIGKYAEKSILENKATIFGSAAESSYGKIFPTPGDVDITAKNPAGIIESIRRQAPLDSLSGIKISSSGSKIGVLVGEPNVPVISIPFTRTSIGFEVEQSAGKVTVNGQHALDIKGTIRTEGFPFSLPSKQTPGGFKVISLQEQQARKLFGAFPAGELFHRIPKDTAGFIRIGAFATESRLSGLSNQELYRELSLLGREQSVGLAKLKETEAIISNPGGFKISDVSQVVKGKEKLLGAIEYSEAVSKKVAAKLGVDAPKSKSFFEIIGMDTPDLSPGGLVTSGYESVSYLPRTRNALSVGIIKFNESYLQKTRSAYGLKSVQSTYKTGEVQASYYPSVIKSNQSIMPAIPSSIIPPIKLRPSSIIPVGNVTPPSKTNPPSLLPGLPFLKPPTYKEQDDPFYVNLPKMFNEDKREKKKKKLVQGFLVAVKSSPYKKNEFQLLGYKPKSYSAAKSDLFKILGETLKRSGRIVPSNTLVEESELQESATPTEYMFRRAKRDASIFVQKTKYSISSMTEKQLIRRARRK